MEKKDSFKILYVEDDKIDRLSFERHLEQELLPLNYQMAISAGDALEIVKTEEFDLVLSDFMLGDGTALDIIKHAKHIPVIVLTGEGTEEVAVKCMRAGAVDYLIKDSARNYLKLLPLIIQKIESQRQTEQERRLFESVFDNANDGILIARNNARNELIIEHINQAFCENLKCAPEEYIGESVNKIYCIDRKVERSKYLAKAVKNCRPAKFECKHIFTDESYIWLEANMVPMQTDSSENIYWLLINRDITERKRKHEELVEARRQAEQASIEKERFLVNMNHEIRTPLNGILGMIQLLEKSIGEEKTEEFEYIESLRSSAKRLMSLLDNILDYSKIISGEKELEPVYFSLNKLITDAEHSLRRIAEDKDISVQFSVGNEVPEIIYADPVAINQILLNLANNAIKFTKEGYAHITVSAQRSDNSEAYRLQISIEDTGVGIKESDLERILNEFTQAEQSVSRNFEGAGLGLTIAHNLVDLMGGNLKIKSNQQVGTTVFVEIPIQVEDEILEVDLRKEAVEYSARPVRILLVEDNKINRKVIVNLLSEVKIKIIEAENGMQALNYLKQSIFDAILMDIQLPDINGIEITRKVRQGETTAENTGIPIIGISASNRQSIKNKCLQAGMNYYLNKPFEPEPLLKVLQTEVDRLKYNSGTVKKGIGSEKNYTKNKSVKVVDLRYLQRMVGGSKQLKHQLMHIFIEKIPDMLNEIETAMTENDWDKLSARVHKLKTSINYMGITSLKPVIKRLENLNGNDVKPKKIRQDVNVLIDVCRKAQWEIKQLV